MKTRSMVFCETIGQICLSSGWVPVDPELVLFNTQSLAPNNKNLMLLTT